MYQGNILIVDDEPAIADSLQILLKEEFPWVTTLKDPSGLIPEMRQRPYHAIMLDMNFRAGEFSGEEGLHWLREILKEDKNAQVIMITAYGDFELAVKAIKEGAYDFISKPWDPEKLMVTLKNACELRKSKEEVSQLRERQEHYFRNVDSGYRMAGGSSPVMKKILKTVEKVAVTDANVLILGENGTGKELLAREIHRHSARAGRVFIPVDVAALTESLFESEMFGHVRGSFTDAKEDRPGRFEIADGGTLFLDEIGNLSLSLQAKLLTAIQKKEIIRVGSSRAIPVDIRLITATNKPLSEMIRESTFREDLYYRLNTITIELPPLRDRVEDIPELAEAFLEEYALKYGKAGLRFTGRSMERLRSYPWPGNIRELRHCIEKAVILSDSHSLRPEDLQLYSGTADRGEKDSSLKLEEVEKNTIARAIRRSAGNLSKAADELDISRTTLYAKIKKYGL